jgi:Fic family protein
MSIRRYCQLDTNRYLNALSFKYANPRLDSDVDLTGWLEFFADGVLYELHTIAQRFTKQNNTKPALNHQHLRIIKFIERNGSISPHDYYVIPSHGTHSLKFYLDNLVRLGFIETMGQGKGIYYVLRSDILT